MSITNKKRVLFISKHAVHAKMAMAGNQIFFNTLLSFCEDDRFECGFITVQKQGADFEKMKSTFSNIAKDFSVRLPNIWTGFTYLFYNTFLRILFSMVRSDWYLLDPIYRFYFKKAIKRTKNQSFVPDVVILEWTEVLFLAKFCRKIFPNAKIVVTEHDVSFTKVERRFKNRPLLQRELVIHFRRRELKALNDVDLVRVLSKDDKNTLIHHHIAPEKIRLVAPFFQKKNLEASGPIKNQIVFYGALNRSENHEAVQWFIEKVYKPFELHQYVSFVIVGGGNTKLKEQYDGLQGIVFTGFVEEPASIFVESLCMVVPLRNGGGIKIKVLEGMTCSLPVLTNEIGIEGIGGKDGSEFVYCKTPDQYVLTIKKLIDNPALRLDIGNSAREWVNEHFDYQKDLEQYKSEISSMV